METDNRLINDLNRILKSFKHTDEFIMNDGDNLIKIQMPLGYANISLDFDVPEGYQKYSIDQMIEYFNNIVGDNFRIKIINGLNLSIDDCNGYYCDYCHTDITDDYYYCYDCHDDMCRLCYIETSEEIAIANGAQNYHKRKDKLNECQKHHNLKPRRLSNPAICDLCKDSVIRSPQRYHNENDYDLCLNCSQTDEGQNSIKNNDLKLIDNILPCYQCDFGSLMDWIPLVQDCEGNMILINANPDSPFYSKYALSSVDNHGRMGFYTIWEETSIQSLISEINSIIENRKNKRKSKCNVIGQNNINNSKDEDDGENDEEDESEDESEDEHSEEDNDGAKPSHSWEAFYTVPIKKMMERRNMKVHYG